MSAHTPGPLRYQKEINTGSSAGPVTKFEVYRDGGLYGHPATCDREADAAEIVRRWNAHEELLAVAESALEDLRGFSGDEDYWARVATLRAVLAKARGAK